MAQTLIRNEDFKSGSTFDNVRGLIYKGNGTPTNRVNAANIGAIYIDQLTGQLWIATSSGEPGIWRPYFTDISTSVRIDSDVQEGDVVGIFGPGVWTASGNMNISRSAFGAFGSRNSGVAAGGSTGTLTNSTELFNGSVWYTSGSISTTKNAVIGIGSQNSGLVTCGGDGVRALSVTELFDGSTWTTGNITNNARYDSCGAGSQNAGLIMGGNDGSPIAVSEVFNGSAWTLVASISAAKSLLAGAGSQNAGLIMGGTTNGGVSGDTDVAELFNGSAWSKTGRISIAKQQMASSGSQYSAFIGAGTTGSGAPTNLTELFNGSTWTISGTVSIAKRDAGGMGGQSDGVIAGGTASSVARNITELHTQSIYRKLIYSALPSALNVGVAFNSSSTSLTASVLRGNVSGDIVPGSTWFGISRHNSSSTYTFVTSTTATVSAISSTISNQAVLNLSTTLTDGFAKGMLLKVSDGTLVPIIGGTSKNPVVRWENVSTSASTSLTVGCVWGQRIYFDPTITIQAGATNVTFSQGPSSLTFNYQGRVGDVLYVPYSNISGTSGSSVLYGTYLITNITVSSSNAVYTAVARDATLSGTTEANIGGVTLYQQLHISTGPQDPANLILGFNNKMRVPVNPYYDDSSNGFM